MICPKCNSRLSIEQINIKADIAQCINCGLTFKVSDYLAFDDPNFNIDEPPAGAWSTREFSQTIIGATTRSYDAFFLIPFAMFWSGASLNGIYGSQIRSGQFHILLSLFGIAFLIGSFFIWKNAIMSSFGKIEITTDPNGGKVFTGIGKIGTTKTFEWKNTYKIYKENFHSKSLGEKKQIVVEGANRIIFGKELSEDRVEFLLKALQKMKIESSKISTRQ